MGVLVPLGVYARHPLGGIGRRAGLKIQSSGTGSSPVAGISFMKIRFPLPHTFPTFLNLGLHQQQEPRVTPRSYERKSETVENPSRLALRLTEFVSYLWTLINAGSHIAIINNDENYRFSYED